MVYCTDSDLLPWEPNVFRDAVFASQQLLAGSGTLTGTEFVPDSASFEENHVAAGQVIVLGGAISGCFPIVSVEGPSRLTLSVLYDGLWPDDGSPQPSPVGSAAGLSFSIRTFFPQRKVVSDLLRAAAGLEGRAGEPCRGQVLNPSALRRPCVLGTLQLVYSAMAAVAAEPAALSIRADLYERLYRRALAQTRVEIDLDGDQRPDRTRVLGTLDLRRA